MHSAPKIVAKRKIDPPMVVIENKIKRVKMCVKVKKSATKAELIVQLESIIQKFEALEEEHNKNIDVIKALKEENAMLVQTRDTLSQETQTESEIILCHKCDYEAEDKYELDAHTYTEHDAEQYLICRFCEHCFNTKKELMIHRKKYHIERVNICRDFSKGVCPFIDNVCWYKHDQSVNEGGIDTAKIKCNKCDKEFGNKPEFMRHKKQEHRQSVPACVNETQGTCVFGEEKCWFRHNNKDGNNQTNNKDKVNENKEVMERIFNMMENMTNRIMKMEERYD